jgi:hypothetical protein
MQMKADTVMAMLAYEKFRDDYERAYIEMNKERH